MKQTPLNTGKVQIGLFYEPPPRNYMTPEAEQLQSALLKPAPRFLDLRQQEWRLVVKDTLMLLALCAALLAMMYSPQLFALLTGA
jgi:hypothetical protein